MHQGLCLKTCSLNVRHQHESNPQKHVPFTYHQPIGHHDVTLRDRHPTARKWHRERRRTRRKTRPLNVLFIMADDCMLSIWGFMEGGPDPAFERIGQGRHALRRCFQSAPMCSPPATLYTGLIR